MTDPHTTPACPPRREDRARHRQAIIDAATALFAAQGFHAATMQAIAARAEVSVGYLYKHFASKDDIFAAILAGHLDRINELIAEVQQRELPPLTELRATLDVIAHHFNLNRDFMHIYHDNLDAVLEQSHDEKANHRRLLIANLAHAHARGELRACDIELVASAVLGASRELFLALAKRKDDNPFTEMPNLLFSLLIDPLRPSP
jgi:AcrR family transcriptional regulator